MKHKLNTATACGFIWLSNGLSFSRLLIAMETSQRQLLSITVGRKAQTNLSWCWPDKEPLCFINGNKMPLLCRNTNMDTIKIPPAIYITIKLCSLAKCTSTWKQPVVQNVQPHYNCESLGINSLCRHFVPHIFKSQRSRMDVQWGINFNLTWHTHHTHCVGGGRHSQLTFLWGITELCEFKRLWLKKKLNVIITMDCKSVQMWKTNQTETQQWLTPPS